MLDLEKLTDLVLDLKLEECKKNVDLDKIKDLEKQILTYLKSNI